MVTFEANPHCSRCFGPVSNLRAVESRSSDLDELGTGLLATFLVLDFFESHGWWKLVEGFLGPLDEFCLGLQPGFGAESRAGRRSDVMEQLWRDIPANCRPRCGSFEWLGVELSSSREWPGRWLMGVTQTRSSNNPRGFSLLFEFKKY